MKTLALRLHPVSSRARLATILPLALCLGGFVNPTPVRAQADDFDDGDDAGWEKYDRTGTAVFSFPNGGYRMWSLSPGSGETGKALVVATRTNLYSDFYVSVDLVDWDDNTITNARSAIGLVARAGDVGPGTTKALTLYWTPAISGGGNRAFSIYYLWNDVPIAPVAATVLTLEKTNSYRMVFSCVSNLVEGMVYNLKDLTRPIAYCSAYLDSIYLNLPDLPESGRCGLLLYSRNNTTVSVTYDNYFAAVSKPAAVPPPGIPHPIAGTPQVTNRVPVSDANFHPWSSGISFNATTLGGNDIPPSGIQMWLNGQDVSSLLSISGAPNNRTVTFNGLTSNQLYHAAIRLVESGGKASTNEFWFDTFSESYLTNHAKLVEAEDYNYSSGQYQDDPPPSGFAISDGTQVNGFGVGYLDLVGTANVDFRDQRTSPEASFRDYRYNDPPGTWAGVWYYQTDAGFTLVKTNDTRWQKSIALDLPDYHVCQTRGGEWLNYTRQFNAGRYHVYLRLSCRDAQDIVLSQVTSDPSQTNQTTVPLGRFRAKNTGHMSLFRYFQLVDDSGNPVVLNWSGTKTFRLTMDGPEQDLTNNSFVLNYLLFVPAPLSPFPLINPNRVGNVFSVSFPTEPGATYTLQFKNALSDSGWTDGNSVAGDGTVKTLTDTSAQPTRFYRVQAQ